MACPQCGSEPHRVLYAGLPLWLCPDEHCCCVWGFWDWVFVLAPFNGVFFVYPHDRPFAYVRALWAWLRGEG